MPVPATDSRQQQAHACTAGGPHCRMASNVGDVDVSMASKMQLLQATPLHILQCRIQQTWALNLPPAPPHLRLAAIRVCAQWAREGDCCRRASAQAAADLGHCSTCANMFGPAVHLPAHALSARLPGPPTSLSSAAMTPLLMDACLEAFQHPLQVMQDHQLPILCLLHTCMRIQTTRVSAIDIDVCVRDRHKYN